MDDIIIFHSLSKENILKIVDIQLERILKRLAERKLTIDLTKKAKQLMADNGWEPQFGARPLKRVIEKELLDPLSREILSGQFAEGDKIRVDAKDGKLVFEK